MLYYFDYELALINDFEVLQVEGKNSENTGTMTSSSPEQVLFKKISRLSDIYSMGTVILYLISGRHLKRKAYGDKHPSIKTAEILARTGQAFIDKAFNELKGRYFPWATDVVSKKHHNKLEALFKLAEIFITQAPIDRGKNIIKHRKSIMSQLSDPNLKKWLKDFRVPYNQTLTCDDLMSSD